MPPTPSATRARAGLFLALTLGAALFSAVAVSRYLGSVGQQATELTAAETVDVVVAARNLYVGQAIRETDLVVRTLAKEAVPEFGVFNTIAEVQGRTPKERVLANELLRQERLARADAGVGLNAIVQPGRRAMTIAVTTETAVAGLLLPNNFVDIIVTIRPDDEQVKNWYSETILQGVKVLAVGNEFDNRNEAFVAEPVSKDGKPAKAPSSSNPNVTAKLRPSITLEVTAEEAERLALAVNRGDISVVLRSDIDIAIVDDTGRTGVAALLGRPAGAPEAPPSPSVIRTEPPAPQGGSGTTIDVVNGNVLTQVGFDAAGNPIPKNDTKNKR